MCHQPEFLHLYKLFNLSLVIHKPVDFMCSLLDFRFKFKDFPVGVSEQFPLCLERRLIEGLSFYSLEQWISKRTLC